MTQRRRTTDDLAARVYRISGGVIFLFGIVTWNLLPFIPHAKGDIISTQWVKLGMPGFLLLVGLILYLAPLIGRIWSNKK